MCVNKLECCHYSCAAWSLMFLSTIVVFHRSGLNVLLLKCQNYIPFINFIGYI
jgi:hypothetical protein